MKVPWSIINVKQEENLRARETSITTSVKARTDVTFRSYTYVLSDYLDTIDKRRNLSL